MCGLCVGSREGSCVGHVWVRGKGHVWVMCGSCVGSREGSCMCGFEGRVMYVWVRGKGNVWGPAFVVLLLFATQANLLALSERNLICTGSRMTSW
jgi:hypothetical protein